MMNAHDEVDDRLRKADVNDDAAMAATKDDEDDTSVPVVDNEINNDDDGDENTERLLQEEEDEEQRAAIAAARLRHQQRPEKQRRKLSKVLDQADNFPVRQRMKINQLVEDFLASLEEDIHDIQRRKLRKVLEQAENFPVRQRMKINQLVDDFLTTLEEDIHDMVTDQRTIDYQGLDSERDTEAEVETALRIFPNNLRRRKRDQSGHNKILYPIHCLSLSLKTDTNGYISEYHRFNIKAVSFIHLFARLAIELKSFEEKERGGLLIRRIESDPYSNVLGWLASSPQPDKDNNDHNQHGDEVYLLEIIHLRKMNLMKKEDILQFGLIEHSSLSPRRLRFLVEWCPQSLLHVNEWGHLPLHNFIAANGNATRPIQNFQTVFDYCIRYYPKMKGINLLFQQDSANETPYQDAIERFGRKKVMEVVEEILTRYANTTPIQTEEAVILAATDDRVHLDGVYFLLRRDPEVLCGSRLLLPKVEATNDGDDNDDGARKHTIIRNNMANDGTHENNNIGADDNGDHENNIDCNDSNCDLDLTVEDDNGSSSNNNSVDDDANGAHPANGRNRKRQRIK